MTTRPAAAAALLATVAVASWTVTACAASDDRELTVAVPTSLRAVMSSIATSFEHDHPGVDVTVRTAEGADPAADVIATADEAAMDRLGDRVVTPRRVASNSLVIVLPSASTATSGITGFTDLARSGLRVAVCAEHLPCGSAVTAVERRTQASVTDPVRVRSSADAVAQVLAGRVDAALAYRTDAPGADSPTRIVADPVFSTAINRYPIGVARDSPRGSLAAEFIAAVIGPVGGRAFVEAGFGPPSG
ncbi:substrate-binding domain-containing protein [Gordonia shandongensis]|uniref:substrate-binding domain-containing protein n=1 Tax=Gordonia shandongensis TaxID=376351 RepID=UPI0004020CDD|nr:substrate-binding domain-containing protein [Gordonia shandongensis]